MLSIEKFKEALGDEKDKMSEDEILRLRENQDKMAENIINSWLSEINQLNV